MSNEPNTAILDTGAVAAHPDCAARRQESIGDYWALTKPEVNFLILTSNKLLPTYWRPVGAFKYS